MANLLRYLVVYFSAVQIVVSSVKKQGSVYYVAETKEFQFKEDYNEEAAATGTFKDEISTTGWSYLSVKTNATFTDEVQAMAAGMLEGKLTYELIHASWLNTVSTYCQTPSQYCTKLNKYLSDQRSFVKEMVGVNGEEDDYWHQVNLVYIQLDGLTKGYAEATAGMKDYTIDAQGFLFLNLGGDLEDLEEALGAPEGTKSRVLGSGSCSAIIKLLPGHTELFTAHDTWGPLTNMLRIYKRYEFSYHTVKGNEVVPGSAIAFSSYPAAVLSIDDYYIISSGLVTQETTNGNNNDKLWQYVQPRTVLDFVRCMVANRLANSGEEWSKVFEKYNSGTYNNQWMIVDYKLFKAGKELQPNTLWILEQLPGYVEYHDMTSVLSEKGYWASYNIPAFPTVFKMSGMPALVEQHGNWFTHDKHPRALIFARNQSAITDLDSLYLLMRYNNYKHDPLSRCNCTPPYTGENSIAARSDLNPPDGKYAFSALGLRNHAAVDTKITSSKMVPELASCAVSGPTHQQQPVFVWSTSPFANLSHIGMPERWEFDRQMVEWTNL
eukprot:m.307042 g.307042  ORF g.307042 m.307042 type:complete len:550 (+) comp41843_c0_seq1:97-1746(+)